MFVLFVVAAALLFQEGHPLVGSWHGNWGSDEKNRSDFTVVMDWDGKTIVDQPELNRMFLISGENRDWRRIAMEPGRKHPPEDQIVPSYFGDSIGHWEGETLVVDTVGFNERFWVIRGGLPHTRFLHLIERFTRLNYNTLKYEVTIDDKGAYTRPWSGGWLIPWQTVNYDNSPGGEIHEYFCHDNERDSEDFKDK